MSLKKLVATHYLEQQNNNYSFEEKKWPKQRFVQISFIHGQALF